MLTWKDVPGWFSWNDLYDEVAITTPPGSVVVEVGVAFGRSLLYLAHKIKETGKDIKVYAVDPWEPYPELYFCWPELYGHEPVNDGEREAYNCRLKHGSIFAAFLYHLYESGLSDIVRVVRAPSIRAARMFFSTAYIHTYSPHFVYIDGDHREEAVRQDLDSWWALCPEWMAGHDYNPDSEVDYPDVWKAVDAKFGRENIEDDNAGSWIVRRSHLERPGGLR